MYFMLFYDDMLYIANNILFYDALLFSDSNYNLLNLNKNNK